MAALIAWVAAPCLVLGLLAGGFRPSHTWPTPPEQWASGTVLGVQMLCAALIFQRLLATWSSTLAAALLAAPPLAGAAVLTSTPALAGLLAWLWLATWLLALDRIARVSRRFRSMAFVPAATALCFTAWPILLYVSAEADRVNAITIGRSLPSPVAWAIPTTVFAVVVFFGQIGRRARQPH